MPNLPETFIAFFAILKIGAIVMPLFSGFGPSPIQSRLNHGERQGRHHREWDVAPRRRRTAEIRARRRRLQGSPSVQHVIVADRRGLEIDTPMRAGRDHWWNDVVPAMQRTSQPLEMQAEDPAILLYTSGTTGEPKGCIWTHIGFIGSMVTRDVIICGDFKSFGPLFLLQRHGLDGRRDVRLHSELRRRQSADRGRHARLSRHRTLLAPDRGSSGHLSRRVAHDRPQPDALRRGGRELRPLEPDGSQPPAARPGPRRRGAGFSSMSARRKFRSSIFQAEPKSAAASSRARQIIR